MFSYMWKTSFLRYDISALHNSLFLKIASSEIWYCTWPYCNPNNISINYVALGLSLLVRWLCVPDEYKQISTVPMGQQLVSFEGKARPTFIRLVQVHTFITSYNELGILGRICQGGAAQCTSVCIQLYFRILLDGQRVALSKGRQEGSE